MNTPENSNIPSPSAAAGSGADSDWENRYRLNDTPWEKGASAPPLLAWLKNNSLTGRVLVPGCGSGHDVRALAQVGAEPVGLDIAPSAIKLAEARPRVGSENYRIGDLFALPDDLRNAFDWVFEHTCFCAIDPSLRTDYVDAVADCLRPGGNLLAIFYLDPGHDHPGDGPPFGSSRAELDALFCDRFETLSEEIPMIAYAGREGRELLRVLRRR